MNCLPILLVRVLNESVTWSVKPLFVYIFLYTIADYTEFLDCDVTQESYDTVCLLAVLTHEILGTQGVDLSNSIRCKHCNVQMVYCRVR